MNEIKISEIISYLFTKKLLIASSTFCVAIITIIISLSVKEIYRSEALVTITPDSLSVSPQPSSGLSTFASFAGINLESGTETKRTPSYVVAKITSKSFFKYLASFPSVIEGIMADKSFDPQNGKIIYDQKIYDPQSKQWKRSATGSRSSRPTYIEAYEIFMANLNVIADRKTGFITIVYDHSSPFFAKKIVDLI